jgi:aspartate racemase
VSEARTETRCLGLIGGLGPAATVHYYRELVAAIERQARVPRLLIVARYLAGLVAGMAAGGAEFTAIVAATPHICAPQFAAVSPLPLIDMLDEVAAVLRAKSISRVALLGTRFTVETHMFGRLGVDTVMPSADEIARIHHLFTEMVHGRSSAALLDEMRGFARTFIARDGAQTVLIAGTDLSPLLDESNCDFPLIDCARVHIDAIARHMLG